MRCGGLLTVSLATPRFRFLVGVTLTWSLSSPIAATAQALTGLNSFNTGSAGENVLGWGATYGSSGTMFYVLPGLPPTSLTGSFLNSGNVQGPPSTLSIDLSKPGTYSFTYISSPTVDLALWPQYGIGLNLFFDGDNINPRISVFGMWNPDDGGTGNYPPYTVNSSAYTPTLDPYTWGWVPGAGTLSFSDGGVTIALTEYRTNMPGVFSVDLVSQFSLGPDGIPDQVNEFTLEVTAAGVPEPASFLVWSLLGASGVGLGWWRRRKRAG